MTVLCCSVLGILKNIEMDASMMEKVPQKATRTQEDGRCVLPAVDRAECQVRPSAEEWLVLWGDRVVCLVRYFIA